MNYQQAVQKNFDHMGTHAAEWMAVPVLGTEEVDCDGTSKAMPVFAFPAGFTSAPSLYDGECCRLCGTSIKNVYWIQNTKRRWVMAVGSECVTHFGEGESGQELTKKTLWAQNRELLVEVIDLRRALWNAYSRRISLGYGRFETGMFPRCGQSRLAVQLHADIKKCLGTVKADSANGAITRWANKHREHAQQLIERGHALVGGEIAARTG